MEGYIGEIRLFSGTFAPQGWAFCDGSQVSISNYEAAYSILGDIYGGNQQTFQLPDLRGRVPVGTGQGAGLPVVTLGQTGGTETSTMTVNQMPSHTHMASAAVSFPAFSDSGDVGSAADAVFGALTEAYSTQAPDTHIGPVAATGSLTNTGGGMAFTIVQPVLATNYIICLEGIYPSRP